FPTRHAPRVGSTVTAVHRVPAAKHRESSQFLCETRTDLAELHSGNSRVNDAKRTFDRGGSSGLGIERVVMARTAVRPDVDAVDVGRRCLSLFCGGGLLPQPEGERDEAASGADFQK